MKSLQFIAIIILSLFFFQGQSQEIVSADNPLIEYSGRIDFSNPLKPSFAYSGVSIRVHFKGTGISMNMKNYTSENYFQIIIDNTNLTKLKVDDKKSLYELAVNLTDTVHEIEIFRRSEVIFGKSEFSGFVLSKGGNLVDITNKRDKLIEFIGNSITCGYGNEGPLGESFSATSENHYMTYAAIASRSLNAKHVGVCRSGIGIYRNYDGPVTGNSDNMPNVYSRIFIDQEIPKYDFSKIKPDLICIDLGTNDFSTSKGDSARYVSAFLNFIDTLQVKNNSTDILCLLGPMMGGNDLSRVRRYLQYISKSVTGKGKGNVYFFEMSAQGDLGLGVDYHPTVRQHIKNGIELINYIHHLKGWQINPILLYGNLSAADHIELIFNTEINDTQHNFKNISISSDSKLIEIKSVTSDSKDKKVLHIWLEKKVSAGQSIELYYKNGTIQSSDGINVKPIYKFIVANILTKTEFLSANINVSGNIVKAGFNKGLALPANLDGLKITKEDGSVLEVKDFKLSAANKTLEINLLNSVSKGENIFVSYSGTSINGIDGIELEKIEKTQILNNSTVLTSIKASQQGQFSIYPNLVTNGILNYKLINQPISNIKVDILNMQGKLVQTEKTKQLSGSIRIKSLNQGIYLIRVSALEKSFIKKIVLI